MSLRVFAIAFLAILGLAAASRPAQAQVNPFRTEVYQLTDEDLAIVEMTTAALLRDGRTGSAAAWSNPESGNSGIVSLEESFSADGAPCRRFGHVLRFWGEADPRKLNIVLCRVGAEWKLLG